MLKTVMITPNRATLVRQKHVVDVPPLCPKTHNPLAGSCVEIEYIPRDNQVLEVYALTDHIHGFYGSQVVRDIEQFALVVAQDCGEALSVYVEVRAEFVLNIGQTVTTWVCFDPATA